MFFLHNQNNNIQSLHEDTFCNLHDRNFIRRNLEDIRLDGNPLNINLFPQAYICLPRLPVGSHWQLPDTIVQAQVDRNNIRVEAVLCEYW